MGVVRAGEVVGGVKAQFDPSWAVSTMRPAAKGEWKNQVRCTHQDKNPNLQKHTVYTTYMIGSATFSYVQMWCACV